MYISSAVLEQDENGQQRQWASESDWQAHRENITRLYWDEEKPLKVVREMMRQEYGFDATERMYKIRFKSWGLRKNLRKEETSVARGAAKAGILTVPVIRNRLPGSKRLKHYISRTGVAPAQQPQLMSPAESVISIDRRKPAPRSLVATHVPAPTHFRLLEGSLRAMTDYFDSRKDLSPTVRPYDPQNQDMLATWRSNLIESQRLIKDGRHGPAFALLDLCLKKYRDMLAWERALPALVLETCNGIFQLSHARHDAADAVVRYIAGLCAVQMGSSHPFARFWAAMRALGVEEMRRAAGVIVVRQIDLLEASGGDASLVVEKMVNSARPLVESGAVSADAVVLMVQSAVDKYVHEQSGPDIQSTVFWANNHCASILTTDQQYDAAHKMLARNEPWMDHPEIEAFDHVHFRTVRSQLERYRASPEEATLVYEERLDHALRVLHPSLQWSMRTATRAMMDFECHLTETGQEERLRRLRAEFDVEAQWKIVCEQFEKQQQGID